MSSATPANSREAAAASTAASAAATAAAAVPVAPAARPFDWYADPSFYDAIFAEDTAVEQRMLRLIADSFLDHPSDNGAWLVLEPACGSGRLLRALLETHDSFPHQRFKVVGFDLSEGAVQFAQRRLEQWQRRAEAEQQHAPAGQAATNADSESDLPPFVVFRGDMINFHSSLHSALHAATPSIPPSLPPLFDYAHCLVSSLKHLLRVRDVVAHFEQVAAAVREGGIYTIAMHVHVLEGRGHFDRRLKQEDDEAESTSASDAQPQQHQPTEAQSSSLTRHSALALDQLDPQEVDDEHTAQFHPSPDANELGPMVDSRAARPFTASLITYQPDTHTMLEKMVARVQLNEDSSRDAASASATAAAAAAVSSLALESCMTLRVYSLSSLHTLLCALSPLWRLESAFSYSDIYSDEWSTEEEWTLPWPFPTPSVEQLQGMGMEEASEEHGARPSVCPVPSERSMRRNWSRVHTVSRVAHQAWEDVDAVVLVLRRTERELTLPEAPNQAVERQANGRED